MTKTEFRQMIQNVIDRNWEKTNITHKDLKSYEVDVIERILGYNFSSWEAKEVYALILGMRDMYDILVEDYLHFTHDND